MQDAEVKVEQRVRSKLRHEQPSTPSPETCFGVEMYRRAIYVLFQKQLKIKAFDFITSNIKIPK